MRVKQSHCVHILSTVVSNSFLKHVGLAVGENCTNTDTTTCGHVHCSDGFTPTCVSNICTCEPAPGPASKRNN